MVENIKSRWFCAFSFRGFQIVAIITLSVGFMSQVFHG